MCTLDGMQTKELIEKNEKQLEQYRAERDCNDAKRGRIETQLNRLQEEVAPVKKELIECEEELLLLQGQRDHLKMLLEKEGV